MAGVPGAAGELASGLVPAWVALAWGRSDTWVSDFLHPNARRRGTRLMMSRLHFIAGPYTTDALDTKGLEE